MLDKFGGDDDDDDVMMRASDVSMAKGTSAGANGNQDGQDKRQEVGGGSQQNRNEPPA